MWWVVCGGGMTETKTGRHHGVGHGRPCQCGVWWQARSVTSQPAEEIVVLRCCCCPEWEGVANLAGGAPAHSQSLLTATSRCLAAGTPLSTHLQSVVFLLIVKLHSHLKCHPHGTTFILTSRKFRPYSLCHVESWAATKYSVLWPGQQTDLLSSEYQTQDLTLYTPSGSFQSLLVTEVAAGYRGKPECETLICISLYQLPTSKMSLISLVTVVSTAHTFYMQYCKSVAAEI